MRRRSPSPADVESAVGAAGEVGRHRGRDAWVERLRAERKLERLFELEVLLRGLGCFANPRNHPGGPRSLAIVAQDFREHAALVRESLAQVVQLCQVLAADRERAFVFQGYLESVTPDDAFRNRWVQAEDGPEGSLLALRQGLSHVLEVATGIARLPRVTFRAFYAVLALAQREIARSAHFRPREPFEYRPEFDREWAGPLHELMRSTSKDAARRALALTALSSFRMLRCVDLVESMAAQPTAAPPKRAVAGVHLVLAHLRSDARAISGTLRRRTGRLVARAFEGEVMAVAAPEMSREYTRLMERGHELHELRSSLESLGAHLSVEVQGVFERDLRPLDAVVPLEALLATAHAAVGKLRPTLQSIMVRIASSLGAGVDARAMFDGDAAQGRSSERLRRDVWLLAAIVRTLARGVRNSGSEAWDHESPLTLVREFVPYFNAVAYPQLRPTDRPQLDALLQVLRNLGDGDFIEYMRLEALSQEASGFSSFLAGLLLAIGTRSDLAGIPFDEASAAEVLRSYSRL
jgi:hypothetical protein